MNYLERRLAKLENINGEQVDHFFINPTETNEEIIARITRETGAPPTSLFVLRLWDEDEKS